MTDRIASTSREALTVAHTTDIDPTTLTVSFAFLSTSAPAPEITDPVWTAGTWDATEVILGGADQGRFLTDARIIVGPGSDVGTLAAGRWRVWTWIDGVSTDPVKRSGDIVVY